MTSSPQPISTSPEVSALQTGELIVYPTEAVYGIGCDPRSEAAVMRLLALKQRPMEKGLILIANDYGQLLPFVDDKKIPMDKRADIISRWPGPTTWLLPASPDAPKWITGQHNLIAVRVTAHPTVKRMCKEFGGAIVSTSANVTGEPTITEFSLLRNTFTDKVACYVDEPLGDSMQPSKIINSFTGEVVRT
jgi:L-threonylcarbamoyladenylate synthase